MTDSPSSQPAQLPPATVKAPLHPQSPPQSQPLVSGRLDANSTTSSMHTIEQLDPRSLRKLADEDEVENHGLPSTMSTPQSLGLKQRLRSFNGMLIFFMLYMALCAFNYGFDVGTFGGVQGMQSFTRRFGEYDEKLGRYALPGWLSSIMTAVPFLGKAAGTIICGPIAEKWGRRAAILGLCVLSLIGVILQTAASTAAQFTVGRVFTFAMTGMTIVVVPIYQAEASPRALRGMFGSTIQAMVIFGQVISTLITYGTQHMKSASGWRIPIGLQFLAPAIILALLPFLPESPRWLLIRGRREEAARSLARFRKGDSVRAIDSELEGIIAAHARENQGSWMEVFDRKNRLRTMVAVLAMFGQQITGQAFISQYGVIFYQSQGFGDKAFLYNVLASVISLVAVMFTWFYVDGVGRRPVLLLGGLLMGIWLIILGAIGSVAAGALTDALSNLMVTSIMLAYFFYNLSWAPVSFVVVSETASQRVREKTNLLACLISVLTTFATSFSVPYLINEKYADLGGRVGYIYGASSFVMVIATYFFIPELKGRTLEEVDQMFASNAPLRRFGELQTSSAEVAYGHQIERLEVGGSAPETHTVAPADAISAQEGSRSCVVLDEKVSERHS